jgi:hypothetical protein
LDSCWKGQGDRKAARRRRWQLSVRTGEREERSRRLLDSGCDDSFIRNRKKGALRCCESSVENSPNYKITTTTLMKYHETLTNQNLI